MAENMVIKELLNNPFYVHPLHDKLRIVNKDRPTAPIPHLITHKSKTERCTRHSCTSQYNQVEWLAGCETANKLYCWPYLLFPNKHGGFIGFKSFVKCVTKTRKNHKNSHAL
jgi:hypothetical protein